MRAENRFNCAASYLSGFHDLYAHETAAKTFIGILKIISYALIIPTLILGYQYLKNKKICVLQSSIDNKIDTNRISEVFTQSVSPKENQEKNCSKLIEYLINKLVNFENNDNEQLERSRFEKGFKELSFEAQEGFFKLVNENNCLDLALKWIPKDTRELNFVSGPRNVVHYSGVNAKNIFSFLKELPNFTQLEKISLNLKGLGFYTESVNSDIKRMTAGGGLVCNRDPSTDFLIEGVRTYIGNNPYPILRTLQEIRDLLKRRPNLKWQIELNNFGIGGTGTELGLFGGIELERGQDLEFANQIIMYFKS